MSVRVIAHTVPTVEFAAETGAADGEDIISYCARVSNPSNQANFDTAGKLLKFCMKKKHWSIFTMANLVMEIKCPRDIGRQILRHKAFEFQEFSQRYQVVDTDMFIMREARLQDDKNRQNSIVLPENDPLQAEWDIRQKRVAEAAAEAYQWAIANGIAKECARVVLPEGLTPSVMYLNGTVRQWYHFCAVRTFEDTQKEHRIIATEAYEKLQEHFPFLQEVGFSTVLQSK